MCYGNANVVIASYSDRSGLTQELSVHQYTEESTGQQPQVTILEARDICGGATGRNGMFFVVFPDLSSLSMDYGDY
jgi:hypothetical protein